MNENTREPWKAIYIGSGDWDLEGPVTQKDWKIAASAPDLLDLIEQALPYVEEGEQFNKPSHRGLSKRMRAILDESRA